MKTIQPPNGPTFQLPDDPGSDSSDPAADLIRSKINRIYSNEPDAVTEAIETEQASPKARSKHQKFMHELSTSGKPFTVIQLEWHEYYKSLPDKEKHEVWEEFYSAQSHKPVFATQAAVVPSDLATPQPVSGSFDPVPKTATRTRKRQSVGELKSQIAKRASGRTKLSRKQHIRSLVFALGTGLFAVALLSFGFFNERIIAPFITPSRNVSSTPIITDINNTAVGTDPKIIIPKINVEVPVVYDVDTIEEAAVQKGLERGVVHYATTSNPGETGGGAIFGHSSNNILNRGKYKFAFVLLSRLEKDDTFYIEKDGKRYVYKIFEKRVVSPSDVTVLDSIPGKASTMALITCDPPGTTINRLVVWGEQISPDPNQNIASTAIQTDAHATQLAGNPQSLWSRIWSGIF